MHQVVTTGVERTSFVFFYYPNFEATLPAAIGDGAKMSGEPLDQTQQDQNGHISETSRSIVAHEDPRIYLHSPL